MQAVGVVSAAAYLEVLLRVGSHGREEHRSIYKTTVFSESHNIFYLLFFIYYLLFENRRLCLMNPIVKYKKLDARAVVPQYATPGAAAADCARCWTHR